MGSDRRGRVFFHPHGDKSIRVASGNMADLATMAPLTGNRPAAKLESDPSGRQPPAVNTAL
jgi:hypothetical protein